MAIATVTAPKVGVVGYGGAFNMGRQHLTEMKKAGGVPTVVCDLDEERLRVAEKEFPGVRTYTRLTEMLELCDVDLLAIITPHNTHAPLALECLEAKRHVVIEKPMTITTAECDGLIAAAEKGNLLLSTYHNRHWDGCVLKALEIIADGEIGEVFRVEAHMGGYHGPRDWWRSRRSISGGVLYDWGVHLLEYSLQILGPDAELSEVSGYAKNGFWDAESPDPADANEDEGYVVARFKNGKWLTLSMSSVDSFPKGQERGVLEVTGTKGTLVLWHDRFQVRRTVDGETHVREGRNPPGTQHLFYENILGTLRGETSLIITPEWARRTVHILDLGVCSAREGRALSAKYV